MSKRIKCVVDKAQTAKPLREPEKETPEPSKTAEPCEAWVYILWCNDNSLYTGWTTDPDVRLATHNAGKGAKYTKPRLPVRLVYRERLAGKNEALRRECEIKRMTRAQKLMLLQRYDALLHSEREC